LHSRGKVSSQSEKNGDLCVEASLSRQLWGQFDKQFQTVEGAI
jgi:GTPase